MLGWVQVVVTFPPLPPHTLRTSGRRDEVELRLDGRQTYRHLKNARKFARKFLNIFH